MIPQYWSLSGLAVELAMDRRTVASKLKATPPDGGERGHPTWRLASVVRALFGASAGSDLSAARAKLALTQEELARLRVERERGQLLPADEVIAGWQSAISRSRALLLGIPTAAAVQIVLAARKHAGADDAASEVQQLLTRLIDDALNELANTSFDDDEDGGDEPADA